MILRSKLRACVANRISARLSPAIDTAVDPNTRFKTKFESSQYTFTDLLRMMSIPIGVGFILNLIPSLKGSDDSTFFGWRILAHLGPYHVPHIVQKGKWKAALEELSKAEELNLTESEIAQLLTDIEVVTQRRIAVRKLVKESGMKIFLPIFNNLVAPPPPGTSRKGQSHFEANLRVVMDVVSASPAAERELPLDVIEALIRNNKDSWESTANEDARRFREYRAVLLLKLLQNENNLAKCKNSKTVTEFVTNELQHAGHQPYPALPLMPLLYQFKTEQLGFEYTDVVRKLMQMLGLEIPENLATRKSLKLEYKLDFVNFEKLVYLTICYSSLRVIPMISEYSMKVIGRAFSVIARSVLGSALLETYYRGQEHVIQSAPWYEARHNVVPSACMAVSNIFVGAVILRYFPFCGLPWLMMRAKDSFSDSFRFL